VFDAAIKLSRDLLAASLNSFNSSAVTVGAGGGGGVAGFLWPGFWATTVEASKIAAISAIASRTQIVLLLAFIFPKAYRRKTGRKGFSDDFSGLPFERFAL
jgi:hypothetical protein